MDRPIAAHSPDGRDALPVDSISPSPTNPRKSIDQARLEELAQSIRSQGVIQPIVVRPWPEGRKKPAPSVEYEIVCGERRYRAAKLAELGFIPSIVRNATDAQVEEIQVIENLQREDISALEEAEGYRQLMRTGKVDVAGVAARIGKSTKYVYDRVKLLDLTKPSAELLRSGRITPGHAILLARLSPKDQARAIGDPNKNQDGGLWQNEHLDLTDAERIEEAGGKDEYVHHYKAVSVREFSGWIDEHVRFDAKHPDVPALFPETHATVTQAVETAEKVVHITEDFSVHPDARDGSHVLGPRSWKRADGSGKTAKECDHAVTGVVVVGPGRGQAFKVCIAKKACATHWSAEQRDARARAAHRAKDGGDGEARYKAEQERRQAAEKKEEATRERWKKAAPTILKALGVAVKKAPAKATGFLADLVVQGSSGGRLYGMKPPSLDAIARGRTAEDLVRYLAWRILVGGAYGYNAHEGFPKLVKALGVDAAKILAEVAPEPKAEKAPASPAKPKAPKRKATKAAKRKA